MIGTLHKRKSDELFAGRIVVPIGNRRVNQMTVRSEKNYCCSDKSMWSSAQELWHRTLGHKSISVARDMIAAGKYGVRETDKEKSLVCGTCVEAKNTKTVCDGSPV